jgi:hypothetical protein
MKDIRYAPDSRGSSTSPYRRRENSQRSGSFHGTRHTCRRCTTAPQVAPQRTRHLPHSSRRCQPARTATHWSSRRRTDTPPARLRPRRRSPILQLRRLPAHRPSLLEHHPSLLGRLRCCRLESHPDWSTREGRGAGNPRALQPRAAEGPFSSRSPRCHSARSWSTLAPGERLVRGEQLACFRTLGPPRAR